MGTYTPEEVKQYKKWSRYVMLFVFAAIGLAVFQHFLLPVLFGQALGLNTNSLVCCDVYGLGAFMVRSDHYQWMASTDCYTPQGWTGGGKEIVSSSYCQQPEYGNALVGIILLAAIVILAISVWKLIKKR